MTLCRVGLPSTSTGRTCGSECSWVSQLIQLRTSSSGFGLRSFARYVVRGFVLSSASMRVVAGRLLHLRDRLFGSLTLPNTIASDGQVCSQAGDDIAVLEPAPAFRLGVDFRFLNALHAVRALFHDAAHADGDVRVVHASSATSVVVLVPVQEVEPANLVGTVVRAVARADAAVVDHVVQALGL